MSNVVRIRHTAGAKQRLEDAHKVMGLANILSNELESTFNHWANIKVGDDEMKRLIQLALCPNKETLNHLQKEILMISQLFLKIPLMMLLPMR